MKAYRSGQRNFAPIMGLVDELPVVSLASSQAKAAIGRIILEGRKVKMYSLISGQGLTADHFGGSLFRDALSSRYIFKTTQAQGRYAGLEKEAVKLLEGLERGRAVFDGPVLDKPGIVAVPFVTSDDMLNLSQQPSTTARKAAKDRFEPQTDQEPSQPAYSGSVRQSAGEVVTADYRELPSVPKDIARAFEAYKAGATSVRTMRATLACSQAQAIELLKLIRERYGQRY